MNGSLLRSHSTEQGSLSFRRGWECWTNIIKKSNICLHVSLCGPVYTLVGGSYNSVLGVEGFHQWYLPLRTNEVIDGSVIKCIVLSQKSSKTPEKFENVDILQGAKKWSEQFPRLAKRTRGGSGYRRHYTLTGCLYPTARS